MTNDNNYLHGGDVYHNTIRLDFSVNLNPAGTPDSVIQAARDSIGLIRNYPDPEQRALRAALSETLKIPAEQFLFGNGAAELIDAFLAAAAPERIILPEPSFSEYRRIPETQNTEILTLPLREEADFMLQETIPDLSGGKDDDVLILCTPNNPNGGMIRPERLRDILKACREAGIRVMLDECFIMLSDHPEYAADAALLQEYPNLFVLRTFTKSFAMPGLRLGYGMTADVNLREKMRMLLQPWNISIPATAAGIAAMQETEHVRAARELIRTERAFLAEGLRGIGYKVYESASNYLLFRGPETLGEKLLAHGILIRDCSNYRGLSRGYFRIAVRQHADNRELLDTLRLLEN